MVDAWTSLLAEPIEWARDPDDPYLFRGHALGRALKLRVGDFPDGALFTVYDGAEVLGTVADRPTGWRLPKRGPFDW
ncbi:MAG: hypothetical protein ACJ735_00225 [Actinomycetes bacterium]